MKKVLGVSFGRHYGNSELILREALLGAQSAGAEVELICMQDFEIKPCRGCQVCTQRMMNDGVENLCIQKDDFPVFRDHLLDCDAVIYGAPVYLIRPIASFLVMADRIGPFHDVGGLAMLGFKREDSPIDQRLFKDRCAGFIAVGGAARPQYMSMGLTLMNDATYPMHIKVVDQLAVGESNSSGEILMHEEKLKRAYQLGINVANHACIPYEEMKWCGDFEGTCPVCHGNLMTLDPGANQVTCAICGIQGDLTMKDGKSHVEFHNLEGSRLHIKELEFHYKEIFASLLAFADIEEEIKEKVNQYKEQDIPIVRPERKAK